MQTRNKAKGKTPLKEEQKLVQTPKKSAQKKKIKIDSNNDIQQDNNNNNNLLKSPGHIKINQAQFVQRKQDLTQYKRLRQNNIIGEGAFGKIYKVETKDTNDVRAMKIIKKDKIPKAVLDEFINEVNILKDLDHPHILKIYEFYDDAKNCYLITEYINGCSLLDEILEQDELAESYICQLMNQIMQGMNYAHKNDLVHRDIKPENIMISKPEKYNTEISTESQNIIKIIDWGTGIKYQKGKYLTQKCGSIDYASPEVFKGKYDQKCDIWSCGVILYILLSGEHPFGQATSTAEKFGNEIKTTKFGYESEGWEDVSSEAKDLINKMLEKNSNKRITAEQALQHPWFQKFDITKMNTQETKLLKRTLARLKNYKAETTMQDAVVSYIASHLISNEEKQELTNTFRKLDKDGNGTLSREEMIKGYSESLGEEEAISQVDKIFEKIDIDGDGSISYNEFIACSLDYRIHFSDDKLRDAFNVFDKDGNGFIDAQEIKNVLGGSLQDNEISQSVWDEVISQVDLNDDGEISFDEFKTVMKRMIKYRETASQQ